MRQQLLVDLVFVSWLGWLASQEEQGMSVPIWNWMPVASFTGSRPVFCGWQLQHRGRRHDGHEEPPVLLAHWFKTSSKPSKTLEQRELSLEANPWRRCSTIVFSQPSSGVVVEDVP